jgi:hypothetical protein
MFSDTRRKIRKMKIRSIVSIKKVERYDLIIPLLAIRKGNKVQPVS